MAEEEGTAPASQGTARASFDDAGVDLGLIRAYLALSPLERLRSLQNAMGAIQKFRHVEPPTVK